MDDLIIGQTPAAAGGDNGAAIIVDGDQKTFMQDVIEASRTLPVMVDFWATWCGPCKLETPWIVELRNKYASQGFEVIGIDSEGDDLPPTDTAGLAKEKAAVAEFVKLEHMPYPVLLGGDGLTKPYGGLEAMPTSFYVDRNGTVVSSQMGISSKDDMEAKIRKAIEGGK